jgi:hypothetical protein
VNIGGIAATVRRLDAEAPGEPALIAFEPGLVPQPQILMADALRARQQGIHELLGLQPVGIAAADNLEPFHGVARRILDAGDLDAADFLIGGQGRWDRFGAVAQPGKLRGELDGILEGELGAAPMAKWAVWAASPIRATWLRPLK